MADSGNILRAIAKHIFTMYGVLCFLVAVSLLWGGNNEQPSQLATNDYIGNFYVAGHMVNQGFVGNLYPSKTATSFWDGKFQKYAEKLLKPNNRVIYAFAYPPTVAMLVAPLSQLSAANALRFWRLLSALALLLATMIFCRVADVRAPFPAVFFSSFLFFPILNVFVAGQSSLVFGLLPLVSGYWLWSKGRALLCGLAWSVLSLKPQLMIPAFLIVVALFVCSLLRRGIGEDAHRREAILMALGLITGSITIYTLGFLCAGFQLLPLWLHAVALTSAVFGCPNTGYWQYHLYISLPSTLILAFSKAPGNCTHSLANIVAVVMIVPASLVLTKLAGHNLPLDQRKDLMLVVAVTSMLAIAPHLLLYDSCMFLLPAWIIFFRWSKEDALGHSAQLAATIIWLTFNAYMASLALPGSSFTLQRPLVLLTTTALSMAFLLFKAFSLTKSGGIER